MTARSARSLRPDGRPDPSNRDVRLLALAFFVVAGAAVFLTVGDYGIASDVPNYFYSSMRQLAWLGEFTTSLLNGTPTEVLNRETVSEHWRWMPVRIPHPPLSREISGIGWFLFRDLLDTVAAYRVGVMVTYAALTASCAAFTAVAASSLLAGMGAGLTVLTIPVLFAHGHLAHTDLFVSAFWFGSAALLYLWTERSRGWQLVLSGLLLGAALATKFSGLLLVPVLGLWLLLKRPRDAVWAVPVLGLGALTVFFLANPLLWVDPVLALQDYFGAGLERSEDVRNMIRTEYFGRIYEYRAPWHYPFVWTLIVIPPTILAAIVAGLFDRGHRSLVGFCLLNVAVLYAALMLPSAPMHDGVRLFLAAFPFYAVLAGVGTAAIPAWLRQATRIPGSSDRSWIPVAVVLLLFVPSTAAVVRTHPYQLSYVNLFVGGPSGAVEKGLEITNLKEVLNPEALEDLVTAIPIDAVIDPGFLLEELCFYQTLGLAPRSWAVETRWGAPEPDGPGLTLVCQGDPARAPTAVDRAPADADFLVLIHRRALWRPVEWAVTGQGDPPFYEVALDGAPLLRAYRFR